MHCARTIFHVERSAASRGAQRGDFASFDCRHTQAAHGATNSPTDHGAHRQRLAAPRVARHVQAQGLVLTQATRPTIV